MSFVDEDLPKREAIRRPNKKISRKKKLTSLFKSCEWLLNMPVIDENGDLGNVSFKSESQEPIKTNNFKELSKGFDILALLDHVLGSHATSVQKLDSIRTFSESAGNIEKCKEVLEFIKLKASQNVYYRKAYQILKEKGL